jgi:hypothetical protein
MEAFDEEYTPENPTVSEPTLSSDVPGNTKQQYLSNMSVLLKDMFLVSE